MYLDHYLINIDETLNLKFGVQPLAAESDEVCFFRSL